MTINDIVKKTIAKLKSEGKPLTPDHYTEVFCQEAKRSGVNVEDCDKVARLTQNLDVDLKNEIKSYNIDTVTKLVRFLSSKLSRTSKTNITKTLDMQSQLINMLLYSLSKPYDEQVAALAKTTKKDYESRQSSDTLEILSKQWRTKTVEIYKNSETKPVPQESSTAFNMDGLEGLSSVVIKALQPSLLDDSNFTIEHAVSEVKKDPKLLINQNTQKDLNKAVDHRVLLDKLKVENLTSDMNAILSHALHQFLDVVDNSNSAGDELETIQEDIKKIDALGQKNFTGIQSQLVELAETLKGKSINLSEKLHEQNNKVLELGKKVSLLEQELDGSKKDQLDELTGLCNRKTIDEILKEHDKVYETTGTDFCIAIMKLDKSKELLQKYGPETRNTILRTVSKVLQAYAESSDFLGRFAGVKILAVASSRNAKSMKVLLEKVVNKIATSKFMYQGQRVEINLNAAIAQRSNFDSVMMSILRVEDALFHEDESKSNQVLLL